MDMYEWTADLNLGIEVIDAQHRQIVQYINDLTHAIGVEDVDEVFDLIEHLRDDPLDHFAFEEQLINQADYVLLNVYIRHEDVDYVPVVKKVLKREENWINSALKRIFGNNTSNV